MANNARNTRKAGKGAHRQGRRKGATRAVGRAQGQASERKRRGPDAAADPQKTFERYMALAREAASSGDAIQSENYYQHAEHFRRQMTSQQAAQHDRTARE